jgi:hypothetical protein
MIKEPEKYKNGIHPAAGLSERDKTWVKTFYPPLTKDDYEKLLLLRSVRLNIAAGEQKNYIIQPTATRYYDISTFGTSDTIMVLFEDFKDELRYITADDDSGEDYNASVRVKLFKNSKYILRIRFYYSDRTGETAVMIW